METYNSQPYIRLHHLIFLGLNNSKTKIDLKMMIIYHINEQHQLNCERYSHRQIGHVFDRLIVSIQIEILKIMMKKSNQNQRVVSFAQIIHQSFFIFGTGS